MSTGELTNGRLKKKKNRYGVRSGKRGGVSRKSVQFLRRQRSSCWGDAGVQKELERWGSYHLGVGKGERA